MPVCPNNANQAEALVDRYPVILVFFGDSVDEQSFDIRLQRSQNGITFDDRIPVLQVEGRLHDPCWTGIVRHYPTRRAAEKEECEADRDEQAFPFRIVHVKIVQYSDIAWYATETLRSVTAKENCARVACAGYASFSSFQQVLVDGRQWLGT